jgi:hypothetical protein
VRYFDKLGDLAIWVLWKATDQFALSIDLAIVPRFAYFPPLECGERTVFHPLPALGPTRTVAAFARTRDCTQRKSRVLANAAMVLVAVYGVTSYAAVKPKRSEYEGFFSTRRRPDSVPGSVVVPTRVAQGRPMKALFGRIFQSFGRALKNVLKPIAKKVRGPLTKLLTPPEFETAINNLENLTHNLKGYVDQSDQLLLAMFRNMQSAASNANGNGQGITAVNLGNQRILAKHPVAPFILLDGGDLYETPRILFNQYQPGPSKAIQQLAKPGGVFVDLGAGQGYHTLTLATIAGRTGRVFSIEPNAIAAHLLRDNLTAVGLHANTFIFPQDRYISTAMKWLKEQLVARQLRPAFIRVGASIKDIPVLDGLREFNSDEPAPQFLFSLPLGYALADQLQMVGYNFWLVDDDGALFRTCRDEMVERSQAQAIHIVAARSLYRAD